MRRWDLKSLTWQLVCLIFTLPSLLWYEIRQGEALSPHTTRAKEEVLDSESAKGDGDKQDVDEVSDYDDQESNFGTTPSSWGGGGPTLRKHDVAAGGPSSSTSSTTNSSFKDTEGSSTTGASLQAALVERDSYRTANPSGFSTSADSTLDTDRLLLVALADSGEIRGVDRSSGQTIFRYQLGHSLVGGSTAESEDEQDPRRGGRSRGGSSHHAGSGHHMGSRNGPYAATAGSTSRYSPSPGSSGTRQYHRSSNDRRTGSSPSYREIPRFAVDMDGSVLYTRDSVQFFALPQLKIKDLVAKSPITSLPGFPGLYFTGRKTTQFHHVALPPASKDIVPAPKVTILTTSSQPSTSSTPSQVESSTGEDEQATITRASKRASGRTTTTTAHATSPTSASRSSSAKDYVMDLISRVVSSTGKSKILDPDVADDNTATILEDQTPDTRLFDDAHGSEEHVDSDSSTTTSSGSADIVDHDQHLEAQVIKDVVLPRDVVDGEITATTSRATLFRNNPFERVVIFGEAEYILEAMDAVTHQRVWQAHYTEIRPIELEQVHELPEFLQKRVLHSLLQDRRMLYVNDDTIHGAQRDILHFEGRIHSVLTLVPTLGAALQALAPLGPTALEAPLRTPEEELEERSRWHRFTVATVRHGSLLTADIPIEAPPDTTADGAFVGDHGTTTSGGTGRGPSASMYLEGTTADQLHHLRGPTASGSAGEVVLARDIHKRTRNSEMLERDILQRLSLSGDSFEELVAEDPLWLLTAGETGDHAGLLGDPLSGMTGMTQGGGAMFGSPAGGATAHSGSSVVHHFISTNPNGGPPGGKQRFIGTTADGSGRAPGQQHFTGFASSLLLPGPVFGSSGQDRSVETSDGRLSSSTTSGPSVADLLAGRQRGPNGGTGPRFPFNALLTRRMLLRPRSPLAAAPQAGAFDDVLVHHQAPPGNSEDGASSTSGGRQSDDDYFFDERTGLWYRVSPLDSDDDDEEALFPTPHKIVEDVKGFVYNKLIQPITGGAPYTPAEALEYPAALEGGGAGNALQQGEDQRETATGNAPLQALQEIRRQRARARTARLLAYYSNNVEEYLGDPYNNPFVQYNYPPGGAAVGDPKSMSPPIQSKLARHPYYDAATGRYYPPEDDGKRHAYYDAATGRYYPGDHDVDNGLFSFFYDAYRGRGLNFNRVRTALLYGHPAYVNPPPPARRSGFRRYVRSSMHEPNFFKAILLAMIFGMVFAVSVADFYLGYKLRKKLPALVAVKLLRRYVRCLQCSETLTPPRFCLAIYVCFLSVILVLPTGTSAKLFLAIASGAGAYFLGFRIPTAKLEKLADALDLYARTTTSTAGAAITTASTTLSTRRGTAGQGGTGIGRGDDDLEELEEAEDDDLERTRSLTEAAAQAALRNEDEIETISGKQKLLLVGNDGQGLLSDQTKATLLKSTGNGENDSSSSSEQTNSISPLPSTAPTQLGFQGAQTSLVPPDSHLGLSLQNSFMFRQFEEVTYLGEGGFGVVYKARNKLDKSYAAFKVKNYKLTADENMSKIERSFNEVKTFLAMKHKHLVDFHMHWCEEAQFLPDKAKVKRQELPIEPEGGGFDSHQPENGDGGEKEKEDAEQEEDEGLLERSKSVSGSRRPKNEDPGDRSLRNHLLGLDDDPSPLEISGRSGRHRADALELSSLPKNDEVDREITMFSMERSATWLRRNSPQNADLQQPNSVIMKVNLTTSDNDDHDEEFLNEGDNKLSSNSPIMREDDVEYSAVSQRAASTSSGHGGGLGGHASTNLLHSQQSHTNSGTSASSAWNTQQQAVTEDPSNGTTGAEGTTAEHVNRLILHRAESVKRNSEYHLETGEAGQAEQEGADPFRSPPSMPAGGEHHNPQEGVDQQRSETIQFVPSEQHGTGAVIAAAVRRFDSLDRDNNGVLHDGDKPKKLNNENDEDEESGSGSADDSTSLDPLVRVKSAYMDTQELLRNKLITPEQLAPLFDVCLVMHMELVEGPNLRAFLTDSRRSLEWGVFTSMFQFWTGYEEAEEAVKSQSRKSSRAASEEPLQVKLVSNESDSDSDHVPAPANNALLDNDGIIAENKNKTLVAPAGQPTTSSSSTSAVSSNKSKKKDDFLCHDRVTPGVVDDSPWWGAVEFEWMRQLIKGMRAIHKKGFVHRDLKPQNCFLDLRQGILKIGDFGLTSAQPVQGARGNSNSPFSPYWGTPMYMPPEGNLLQESTDVYAVGLIMLQLMCPRFVTQMERQLLIDGFKSQAVNVVPDLEQRVDGAVYDTWFRVPRELVRRCGQHEPSRRISSEELHRQLKQFRLGFSSSGRGVSATMSDRTTVAEAA
ncbi:unnamed protein product [Amoebophrya sp. A25]|nr:unnamed protein product [Amoebophrya sp. A25]|eukprot:GSA25T00027312001.1